MASPSGPPASLARSLPLAGLAWHPVTPSTNLLAAQAATAGAPDLYAVLADVQTAGRGRRARVWTAPPGTSLLCSLVLRPRVAPAAVPLLALLAGLALAESCDEVVAGTALKWPNDLLVDGRKAAGILVEAGGQVPAGAVVLGIGVNVDWRGVPRPPELAGATSLAEAAGGPVDRWSVLAALVVAFVARYGSWPQEPAAFLTAYRLRCATLGQRVRVTVPGRAALEGVALDVADDGQLVLATAAGEVRCSAGAVEHVRPVTE